MRFGSLAWEVEIVRSSAIVMAALALAASACSQGSGSSDGAESTAAQSTQPPTTVALPSSSTSEAVENPVSETEPETEQEAPRGVPEAIEMYWPAAVVTTGRSAPPLVVLVPGGGWVSADPTGLIPLAESLADAGAIVATITYRTASDGVYFPEPAEDIACAVAATAAAASASGTEAGEIVVVGHSAGAQLGALFALRPTELSRRCADPVAPPDRFVGLAGPYDVAQIGPFASDLFGPKNTDPADWTDGNPVDHAARRPDLDVLLIHGRADRAVPIHLTEAFAAALVDGGHHVETRYPDGVDHHTVYSAEFAAPLIATWFGL